MLIAAALKKAYGVGFKFSTEQANGVFLSAKCLADRLADENARFDRERFLRAAGVQS